MGHTRRILDSAQERHVNYLTAFGCSGVGQELGQYGFTERPRLTLSYH